MKFTLVALLASMCLALTACKKEYTSSYYFTHPEILKVELHQCQQNNGAPSTFDAHCMLAYNTAMHMSRLMRDFMQNQTEFGQRILRAQIRAADLASQLRIAEQAHLPTESSLRKQLKNTEQRVSNLRAIVAFFIRQ